MKKLTILLGMILFLSINTFAALTTNYWIGGAAGVWTIAGNWSTGAVPGPTDFVVFGGVGGTPTNGPITVTGLPTTTLGGIAVSYGAAAPWNGTYVTLQGIGDGLSTINIAPGLFTLPLGNPYWGYDDYVLIKAVPLPGLGGSFVDLNTLDLNFAGARVNLHMNPGTMIKINGVEPGYALGTCTQGHLKVPLYATCDENNAKKGLYLMGDMQSHAEIVQNATSSDVLYGFIHWNLTLIGTHITAGASDAHLVGAPITTTEVGIWAAPNELCRKQNCLCVFDGSTPANQGMGDYVRYYNANPGSWGPWYGTYNCYDNALDFSPAFVGRGYSNFAKTADKLFFGKINNAPIGSPITFPFASDLLMDGFALYGNPFPSGLAFTSNDGSHVLGWTWGVNVLPSYWYWDGAKGAVGGWRIYNWSTHGGDGSSVIPRGQGFFVAHDATTGSDHTLSCDNEARQLLPYVNIKEAEVLENNLNLDLYQEGVGMIDNVSSYFWEGSTMNYDRNDAKKIFLDDRTEVSATTPDNYKVQIKYLPKTTENITLPLELKVVDNDTYTLKAGELNSFGSHANIVLVDLKNNTSQDLKLNPDYTFTAEAGDDLHRFDLLFSNVLSVPGISDNSFKVFSSGTSIYIQNSDVQHVNAQVTVYDIVGRQMLQEKLSNNLITKINTNFTNGGYYVVSIKDDISFYSQKVYLQ